MQAVFILGKGGVSLEGVRLRLSAWAFRRERDVTATLEVAGGRSFVTLARIDAWPSDPHGNVRREISRRLGLPSKIEACHVHRFGDNAKIGREAFTPQANLPVARPIEGGVTSFRHFLTIVADEFHIDGIADFKAPDTWRALL